MARDNGGIIGPANNPTSSTASGVWDLPAQYQAISGGNWPPIPSIAANSLRFNAASSDYLNRTPATVGNRKTFTFSSWIKISNLTPFKNIFQAGSTTDDAIRLRSSGTATAPYILDVYFNDGINGHVGTNMLFRDVSAWYHIVCAIDTTQATSTDRIKVYINGTLQTLQSINGYPTLNYDTNFNNTIAQKIGTNYENQYFEGYMSEVILVDGQALDPTSFGQFNANGIWTPIPIGISSYGTNGFRLKFENSASLGLDSSPNGNNFTVNNLTSIDQTTDIPTNNFATMNPLHSSTSTFSDGNLTVVANTDYVGTFATIGVNKGKWYFEARINSSVSPNDNFVGVSGDNGSVSGTPYTNNPLVVYVDGFINKDGTTVQSGLAGFSANDIMGIALNMDNLEIEFYHNGVKQGSTQSMSAYSGFYLPFYIGTNGRTTSWNFGNPPFTIASGNSDANGYGNFEYAVPSGYYALCTKNLAEFG